jgi:hypothetical protein
MSNENASTEETLREKLSKECAIVSWSTLYPHLERQAVLWVNSQLDLTEVALSIALDRVSEIQEYLNQGSLVKAGLIPLVSDEGVEAVGYTILIVQPYVIASPIYLPDSMH